MGGATQARMSEYDGLQNFEVNSSRDVSGIDDLNAIGMLTP